MLENFVAMLSGWINSDNDNKLGLRSIKAKSDFLSEVLYNEYRPDLAATVGNFNYKLALWIYSASSDADRLAMFRMLDYIFFLGRNEFDAMYMTAYSRHVATWLAQKESVALLDVNAKNRMRQAVASTLFTAITDSFNIGDFIRINGIHGASLRFTWEPAIRGGFDRTTFVNNAMSGKTRIVLLEDFVGSGSQMRNAIDVACSLPPRYDVLLCPLVICPSGVELAEGLARQYPNLTFEPVLALNESEFVTPNASPDEPLFYNEIRNLIQRIHPLVAGKQGWQQDYGPFGYEESGAMIVKYDNCPDNTLPIIHHSSDGPWSSLFNRVSREEV